MHVRGGVPVFVRYVKGHGSTILADDDADTGVADRGSELKWRVAGTAAAIGDIFDVKVRSVHVDVDVVIVDENIFQREGGRYFVASAEIFGSEMAAKKGA